MATMNVQPYLDNVKAAKGGEDVTGAIYDAIKSLNDAVAQSIIVGQGTPNSKPKYSDMVYIDITNWILYKSVFGSNNTLVWESQGDFIGRGFDGDFEDLTPEIGAGLNKTYSIDFTKPLPGDPDDITSTEIVVKDGNSITEISDPVHEEFDDIYTIGFNEGNSFSFAVHGPISIKEITGPVHDGIIDHYTIVFDDDSTKALDVYNGDTITEITGPVTEGLEDTYTIHYKSETSREYVVKNGIVGSSWYRGNSVYGKDSNPKIFINSGINEAQEGDLYLNFEEGAIYYCKNGGESDTATWVFDFFIPDTGAMLVRDISDLSDVKLKSLINDDEILGRINNQWTNVKNPKPEIDQRFDSRSEKPQSGKAIIEAIRKKFGNPKGIMAKHFIPSDIEGGYNPSAISFDGQDIWTDGTNIYYSFSTNEVVHYDYKLVNNKWEPMVWNSLPDEFYGRYIWTDGTNIYYSYGSIQLKLNKITSTWQSMTWTGLTDFNGTRIWKYGTNIYYSHFYINDWGSFVYQNYKLNGTAWQSVTWSTIPDMLDGEDIWTDGVNIYLSTSDYVQYRFTGTNWVPMTWKGFTPSYGRYIWTDGVNIYHTFPYPNVGPMSLRLNGTTWDVVNFEGLSFNIYGPNIWTDGINVYYSTSGQHYKLNGTIWMQVNFDGLISVNGITIWTDGINVYNSYEDIQYKLNGNKWEPMTWSGLISFSGQYIWTDGDNIYYSLDNIQYKLNGTTWEPMIWSGLLSFSGQYIWTDGANIYYSNGETQYILHGNIWEPMIWSGLLSFSGDHIWTDGFDIYYSYETTQYKLNGTTWESMTWTGLASFIGRNIWTDGTDIYYSFGTNHYKLNGTIWKSIRWRGLNNFYGINIWTDGINIYYNSDGINYKLQKFKVRLRS